LVFLFFKYLIINALSYNQIVIHLRLRSIIRVNVLIMSRITNNYLSVYYSFFYTIETMYKLFLLGLLLTTNAAFCQDIFPIDGQDCGMEGSAKRVNDKQLNRLKNRFIAPTSAQLDANFNWTELAKTEDDRAKFSAAKGVILRGYVLRVTPGGAETCNCNSKTPEFRDTHIVITPDAAQTGLMNQVVIEVTPRMRAIMATKGVDWSQEALKKLRGKKIEVEGWLFYDYNHGNQSAKIRQKSKGVTRSTAWEIHPITRLTVVN
jgi:hypothetical protein